MKIYAYWISYYDANDVASDYGFIAGDNMWDATARVVELYGEEIVLETRIKAMDCGECGYLPMRDDDGEVNAWWQRMEQA